MRCIPFSLTGPPRWKTTVLKSFQLLYQSKFLGLKGFFLQGCRNHGVGRIILKKKIHNGKKKGEQVRKEMTCYFL